MSSPLFMPGTVLPSAIASEKPSARHYQSIRMALNCYFAVSRVLLVVHFVLGSVLVQSQNTDFTFSGFDIQDLDQLLMVDDVYHVPANASIQLNSKGASTSSSSCGKLLFKERVRLKNSASGAVASFNTTFTFKITGTDIANVSHGNGMAFTFARNINFTDETAGALLCLVREEDDGKASNHLFAVEFDTFLSPPYNDTSDSHIGVNINSMKSVWSYDLCGGSIRNCSYLCNGGYFTAWIDYGSSSQTLEVFFANGSSFDNVQKPLTPLITASLPSAVPLAALVDDYVYVGFTGSTSPGFIEVHQIQSWKFTSSGMPEVESPSPAIVPTKPTPHNSSTGKKVGVVAGASAAAVAVLLGIIFCILKFRTRLSYAKQDKPWLVDPNLTLRMFTYKELRKATKNFNKTELLGSGGFGAVYKGTLPSGVLVAVKRMRMDSRHGKESFLAEVTSLSHIRHRNLVQLRGWCHEEDQLLIVYDYMCNGSLDEWLFHSSQPSGEESPILDRYNALPLILRYSVLSGVAAALSYLHDECSQCVLHRDIKASNVLLDGDWNAYLGDFGLARVINHQKKDKTTMMAGTFGYIAPEVPHTGKATRESDVYSFGVLMLEVACGSRALEMSAIEQGEGILVDRVWRAHEAGKFLEVADPRLELFLPQDAKNSGTTCGGLELHEAVGFNITGNDDPSATIARTSAILEEKMTIANLLHLGLLCCNPNPEDRPSMRLVSQWLQSAEEMEMSLPPLPEHRPRPSDYSRAGFSEGTVAMSWSSWSSSGAPNVQSAPQESSESTRSPPFSDSDLSGTGKAANKMQTSFATPDSSVVSGR
ncbi:hypothetical protein KC19_2G162800 [Ceratodon purpureus]|uniref:Protein kinase domain-containing protein n=1 Tax=Ceratodon purpureus TaxID=3225 RepID=A0A8T0IW34_CERPU|nr:hypothetical protein KC19_2G162800 [Ceratodon purpureus]